MHEMHWKHHRGHIGSPRDFHALFMICRNSSLAIYGGGRKHCGIESSESCSEGLEIVTLLKSLHLSIDCPSKRPPRRLQTLHILPAPILV